MMAGVRRIVFQEPDGHPSYERQREVVRASGATWRLAPVTRRRWADLKGFQERWAKEHLPRRSSEDLSGA